MNNARTMSTQPHITLILVGVISLLSCEHSQQEETESIRNLIEMARIMDIDNEPDSVIAILSPLFDSPNESTLDWYTKLVFCRNLARIGAVEKSDSLYRRYIHTYSSIDTIRRDFILEYINFLVPQARFDAITSYSDTLVSCCGGKDRSFTDFRYMCYFLASAQGDQCVLMGMYLDSLKMAMDLAEHQTVSRSTLISYEEAWQAQCPIR